MRLGFFDRENEKARLQKAFTAREGTFCCLYGRWRCGKSRLLQEVLPRKEAVYYVSDEREPTLQRAALAAAVDQRLPGFAEVSYPDWSSLFERWWRDAPAGTVLALDEFPYLVKSSPELPSLLQRLLDQNRSKRTHLVICGSSQRMMQGLVLDASAPLYGRAREVLLIKPLGAAWITKALPVSRPIDVLQAYAAWGGIPRYWELAADYRSTWTAMKELVLDPLGVLHNEPYRLLLDDLRETAQAASILALIGQGCNRVSEIAARLAKPTTSLTRPLQRLLELGFIRREQPFGVAAKSSKKTLYRIDDPFLAFWFRYLEPNRSRLEAGLLQPVLNAIKKDYRHHCGAVWEELARRSVAKLKINGLEWLPAQRWWGAGIDKKLLELDAVAKSVDGENLFVGEIKLSLTQEQLGFAEKGLERKLARLPFAKNYKRIVTGIFIADSAALKKTRSRLLFADAVFGLLK